jgi:uncharacterized membrane protein
VVFIIAGSFVFGYLPLGITEDMLGIYRVLCIGYAFFSVGNCAMMIQLYFSDNKGALISGLVLMAVSCIGTYVLRDFSIKYYGVGFLLGGIAYSAVSLYLLRKYMKHIVYYVLASQPIVVKDYRGVMTRLSTYYQKRYDKRFFMAEFDEGEEE